MNIEGILGTNNDGDGKLFVHLRCRGGVTPRVYKYCQPVVRISHSISLNPEVFMNMGDFGLHPRTSRARAHRSPTESLKGAITASGG